MVLLRVSVPKELHERLKRVTADKAHGQRAHLLRRALHKVILEEEAKKIALGRQEEAQSLETYGL